MEGRDNTNASRLFFLADSFVANQTVAERLVSRAIERERITELTEALGALQAELTKQGDLRAAATSLLDGAQPRWVRFLGGALERAFAAREHAVPPARACAAPARASSPQPDAALAAVTQHRTSS